MSLHEKLHKKEKKNIKYETNQTRVKNIT